MVGLSCSGLECALFVVAVGGWVLLSAGMATLAGLVAIQLVLRLARGSGPAMRSVLVKVVVFVGAAFAVLRGIAAMDDLAFGSWLSIAVVSSAAFGVAYVRLRRLNRAFGSQ